MKAIVDEYKSELFNLCYGLTLSKHDAERLFQQTWGKAVKSASGYEKNSFRPFLFKICVNQFKDNYRQMAHTKKLVQEDFESSSTKDLEITMAGCAMTAEEQSEKRRIQTLMIARIDKLPEHQKVPMVLLYYQQLKYTEIARILRVSEGTVKSRINTAKKKLMCVFEGELNV